MTTMDALVSVVLLAVAVVLLWQGWLGKWGPAVAAVALIGAAWPLAGTLTGPLRAVTGWLADLAVAVVDGFGAPKPWRDLTREVVLNAPWITGVVVLVVILLGLSPWHPSTVTRRTALLAALVPSLVLLAPPGLAHTGTTITDAFAHVSRQVGTAILTFKSGTGR